MTDLNTLPWDDADGTTTVRPNGGDMHARATGLAHAAMMAAAGSTADPADSDYARAKAAHAASLAALRAENAQRHVAANNARAEAARAAKAERQAAHLARIETAKAEAARRRLAKAA